ncbi:MAG: hypothetical protein JW969_18455 [Spirochaetales bacterium]|nr:hypothetical protein [Spirochaetales bacterium]
MSRTVIFYLIVFLSILPVVSVWAGGQGEVNVTNPIQELADSNHDGKLNNQEIEAFTDIMQESLKSPHPVKNKLDKLVDRNDDKQIDEKEITGLRNYLFSDLDSLLSKENEVKKLIDFNKNGKIDEKENRTVMEFLFFNPQMQNPRRAKSPLDKALDLNNNGQVEKREVGKAVAGLFVVGIKYARKVIPMMDENRPELSIKVTNDMDQKIDTNKNGMIEADEAAKAAGLFNRLKKVPHNVTTQFDRMIDYNKDNRITVDEIRKTGDYLFNIHERFEQEAHSFQKGKKVSNVFEEIADMNKNGSLDEDEIRLIEESLKGPHKAKNKLDTKIDLDRDGEITKYEIGMARRATRLAMSMVKDKKFKAKTPADKIFDMNEDGYVDSGEIETVARYFTQGPHKVDPHNRLDVIFNLKKDDQIEGWELVNGRERFLSPHPVDKDVDFDRKSDLNNNNFIEVEEIGIAAGYTEEGDVTALDDRIEEKRYAEVESTGAEKDNSFVTADNKVVQDVSNQKKVNLEGKNIAVIGITTTSKDIAKETLDAVAIFVENAFVNASSVKVIDRVNLDDIMEEQELELSGITDQKTAITIGKLANAHAIVVGEVSYVAKVYYLRIKLIATESAEILGSSIVTAKEDSEFYTMCNDVVYKLF